MLGAQLSGSSSSVRQEGTQVEEVATDATGSVSHGQEGNCRSSSLNHHHHRHHPCGSLLWAKYQSNIKSSQTLHSVEAQRGLLTCLRSHSQSVVKSSEDEICGGSNSMCLCTNQLPTAPTSTVMGPTSPLSLLSGAPS